MRTRKGRRIAIVTILAVVLLGVAISLAGCVSTESLRRLPAPPRVYGGVRTDVLALAQPLDAWQRACVIADFPFSAVVDTIVLPVTVSTELFSGSDE